MKPTVYLPLADLRPTGVRRASTSTLSRFSAGRVAARRLWIETEGHQVGRNDQANTDTGGSGQERTR